MKGFAGSNLGLPRVLIFRSRGMATTAIGCRIIYDTTSPKQVQNGAKRWRIHSILHRQ
jgi:hypothetical protein